MANEEQLAVLKAGVEKWNFWHWKNAGITIDLSEADLGGENLSGVNLQGANLSGANLSKAVLIKAKLFDADLEGANISEANLSEADLRSANLRQANLSRASFHNAKLSLADLSGTHVRGIDLSGAVLIAANLEQIDISGADLSGADLTQANLNMTNLSQANLRAARLLLADLRHANLSGVDLSGADVSYANLGGANLSQANLSEADLSWSNLGAVNIDNAKISKCNVYGVNVWDLEGEFQEQKDLIITPRLQPSITVDNIKVAQFFYLILNNQEIRDVINTLTSKTVLILGRFGIPERKGILDALRDKLRGYDLLPIVFDFDRPTDKDFTETIKTLAGLCYFVIADVTNPKSSPLELQATVPDYQIPFVPIIQKGEQPFAMMVDLQKKYTWVLPTRTYSSKEELIKKLKKGIIEPAMQKHNELRLIKAQEPDTVSLEDFDDES